MEKCDFVRVTVSVAAQTLIKYIEENQAKSAINIGLSGGTSVLRLYDELSAKILELPFLLRKKLILWVLDERHVPLTSSRSNSRLLMQKFAHLNLELFDYQRESCRTYQDKLSGKSGGQISFDMIIAGFGLDGHVASIFPGSNIDNLNLSRGFFKTDTGMGETRYSWSYDTIINSKQIIFIVDGDIGKLEVWKESKGADCSTPLAVINRNTCVEMLFCLDD